MRVRAKDINKVDEQAGIPLIATICKILSSVSLSNSILKS